MDSTLYIGMFHCRNIEVFDLVLNLPSEASILHDAMKCMTRKIFIYFYNPPLPSKALSFETCMATVSKKASGTCVYVSL